MGLPQRSSDRPSRRGCRQTASRRSFDSTDAGALGLHGALHLNDAFWIERRIGLHRQVPARIADDSRAVRHVVER